MERRGGDSEGEIEGWGGIFFWQFSYYNNKGWHGRRREK